MTRFNGNPDDNRAGKIAPMASDPIANKQGPPARVVPPVIPGTNAPTQVQSLATGKGEWPPMSQPLSKNDTLKPPTKGA